MTLLSVVSTVHDARAEILPWRERGESVALVPTMGALHQGHLSLVEQAKKTAKRTIVSIFVNPTQFGPHEDLSKYPRQLEADKRLLQKVGCDLLFTPNAQEMYPQGFSTSVHPGPLASLFEGAIRPGHFAGVATVVIKLLLQMLPHAAVFGEKDYQQLLVIRRVVKDLNLPVHILGAPIVRDADGLALSSRNVYLSADERARALALPRALTEAATSIGQGHPVDVVLKKGMTHLLEAGFVPDYFELVDGSSLEKIDAVGPVSCRLIAAARMGTTRLLDNVSVTGRGS